MTHRLDFHPGDARRSVMMTSPPGEREAEGGGDGQVKRLDLLPGSSTCHTAKWFP